MPKLLDHIDALLTEMESYVEAAWPGQVKVFRGIPNLPITHDLLPCTVLVSQSVNFEPSGLAGSAAKVGLTVLGVHPLPADKTVNLMMEQYRLADLMVEQIESQPNHLWADGKGVNAYVTGITTDYLTEEEMLRIVIDFSVEFHCALGD